MVRPFIFLTFKIRIGYCFANTDPARTPKGITIYFHTVGDNECCPSPHLVICRRAWKLSFLPVARPFFWMEQKEGVANAIRSWWRRGTHPNVIFLGQDPEGGKKKKPWSSKLPSRVVVHSIKKKKCQTSLCDIDVPELHFFPDIIWDRSYAGAAYYNPAGDSGTQSKLFLHRCPQAVSMMEMFQAWYLAWKLHSVVLPAISQVVLAHLGVYCSET